eukprot:g17586.t1
MAAENTKSSEGIETLAPQFADTRLPRSITPISTTASATDETRSSEDTASTAPVPSPNREQAAAGDTEDNGVSSRSCEQEDHERGAGGVQEKTLPEPPPSWSPIDLPPLPVTSPLPAASAWLLYSLTVGNEVLLFVSTVITLAAVINLSIYPFVYDQEKYRGQFLCVQLPIALGVVALLLCQYCWAGEKGGAFGFLKMWGTTEEMSSKAEKTRVVSSKAEYCRNAVKNGFFPPLSTLLGIPHFASALPGLYTACAEKKPDALGSLTMNLSMIAASLMWALQAIFYWKIMASAVGLASFTLLNCVILGINVWLRLRIG